MIWCLIKCFRNGHSPIRIFNLVQAWASVKIFMLWWYKLRMEGQWDPQDGRWSKQMWSKWWCQLGEHEWSPTLVVELADDNLCLHSDLGHEALSTICYCFRFYSVFLSVVDCGDWAIISTLGAYPYACHSVEEGLQPPAPLPPDPPLAVILEPDGFETRLHLTIWYSTNTYHKGIIWWVMKVEMQHLTS